MSYDAINDDGLCTDADHLAALADDHPLVGAAPMQSRPGGLYLSIGDLSKLDVASEPGKSILRRELQAETARFRALFSTFSVWKSMVNGNWRRVGDSNPR